MAVEPLFDTHLFEEIVDIERLRLFDHAVDLDRPGPDLQRLCLARNGFVGAEFVEVVVARRVFLIGQRPVELVALVALCGIERGRGIGIRRPGQATADARCREDRPRRQTLQEAAAIAEDRLARRGALGQFPAASSSDQHRIRPVDSRSMWALRGRPPSHAFVKAPLGLRPSPGFGLRPQPPPPAMRERGFSRFTARLPGDGWR